MTYSSAIQHSEIIQILIGKIPKQD